jgi:putative ABC transport system permease protein
MADLMGMDRVVNSILRKGKKAGKIVGVVKNFHFNSMRNSIEPLVLELVPQDIDNLLIRIRDKETAGTLEFIRKTWERLLPQYPFRSSFLEDDYLASTRSLSKTGDLLSVFSILAILISCLGLFGLSSYSAVRKTKEIGVRKVLGASNFSIIKNISMEFIYLVLLSNLIVWPVAYYVMNQWLQKFAYHTKLSLVVFILAGLATLTIALLTICYQTLKAARANPVDALRYE